MLKLSTTFLLFFIVASASAQLKGSYVYSAGVDAGTRIFTFTDSNFTFKKTGHLTNVYGAGSFKMIDNGLNLYYHHITDKDSSVYKIDTESSYSKYTKISVKVFEDKIAMNGCTIAIRDYDFNIILYTTTVNEGAANLSISKMENVQYLTVDFIGYNRVTIPYKKLIGNENNIYINLKPQKTIIEPARVDFFRVLKYNEDSFTIRNSSGEEYLYKKFK